MTTLLVGVNGGGRRVGDYHPNAKLSDGDVELILGMHSEGWGYKRLAQKFDVTPSAVRHICKGRNRGQRPERWKRVEVKTAMPTPAPGVGCGIGPRFVACPTRMSSLPHE